MKLFTVNENDAGQRVDKFVLKVTLDLPHSLLYKAIRTKKIKVNRKRCEAGQILALGDTLQLFLPPSYFEDEADDRRIGQDGELSCVYEDENLLICDKPAGLSCHRDDVQKTGTLIDRILAYLYRKGEYLPQLENSFAPALCNRIDRNTSGLVICAKNAVSLRALNEMIRNRQIKKEYLAWMMGQWTARKKITVYLKKDADANRVSLSPVPKKGYLTAITEFSPQCYDPQRDRTLARILLHTGRTHQIRATAAYLGHPLVGDSKYGPHQKDPEFSYQALRAFRLTFFPEEGNPLFYLRDFTVSAPSDPLFCPKK